jgi:hypothetical protein
MLHDPHARVITIIRVIVDVSESVMTAAPAKITTIAYEYYYALSRIIGIFTIIRVIIDSVGT